MAESAALTAEPASDGDLLMPAVRTHRTAKGVVLAAAGALAAGAVVMYHAGQRAQEATMVEGSTEMWNEQCFAQLNAEYPEDLTSLSETHAPNDDTVMEWLSAASDTGDAADLAQAKPLDADISKEAEDAISKMLKIKDPKEAKAFVQRAMARAVNQTMNKRRKLKDRMKGAPGALPLSEPSRGLWLSQHPSLHLSGGAPPPSGALGALPLPEPSTRSPEQQVKAASCAFDIASILSTITAMGANINDIAKTCAKVTEPDRERVGNKTVKIHNLVCRINVVELLAQIMIVAATITTSINNCAVTMDTNLDVSCAASVLAMITSGAGGAISGALLYSSCRSPLASSGYIASNVGNNKFLERTREDELAVDAWEEVHLPMGEGGVTGGYSLADDQEDKLAGEERRRRTYSHSRPWASTIQQNSAQPRRLLYGGGKGSMATQCVVQVLNSMWALAGAALSINAAAKTCPPKDLLTGKEKPNGRLTYRLPQAKCAADVSGIFTGFLMMVTWIEGAVISCTDTLNLKTICAEAITGVLATMSLAASSGAGLFLTCDKKSRRFIDLLSKLKGAAAKAKDKKEGKKDTPAPDMNNEDPSGNTLGRRLGQVEGREQAEAVIADLKSRFASPEEAFKSIGFDLDDKEAAYHGHAKVAAKEAKGAADRLLAEALVGEGGEGAAESKISPACGGSAP